MPEITLALLITKPGNLRNGLQSLLRTIPQIELLAEANDPSILLKINPGIHPELIVVDAALLDEDYWSAIRKIKADRPDTKVLVLTENDQQGQTAAETGADFFLLKGFPASELAHLIESSLRHEFQDEMIKDADQGKTD